jgi:MYXO-CTERM domain-containing protein
MLLLPIFAALLSTAQAGNQTVNSTGAALSWQQDEVGFQINPSGKHGLNPDDVVDAIAAGAEQWSAEGAWVNLQFEGESSIEAADYNDGEQVVFFADDWGDQDPGLLALTYVWSNTDGEILHFDVAINTEHHEWSVDGDAQSNDLWNAMTHEFGHALGFDHSDDPDATMYAQTGVGETMKRDLAEDDMELFSELYGGAFPYSGAPVAGCSVTGQDPMGWATLVGMLGLLVRGRRRNAAERGE